MLDDGGISHIHNLKIKNLKTNYVAILFCSVSSGQSILERGGAPLRVLLDWH